VSPSLFALLSMTVSTTSAVPPVPPVVIFPPPPLERRAPTPTEALFRGMIKLTPEEAVMKAASAYPRPVVGVFEFQVRRAELVGPNLFLNSESDYRDQRNLSIRIEPAALSELHKRFGDNLSLLLGRKVRVVGPAVRVRIDFTENGRATGKYYYQTQVPVRDARQVELADGS
jgi:hypothetical protein